MTNEHNSPDSNPDREVIVTTANVSTAQPRMTQIPADTVEATVVEKEVSDEIMTWVTKGLSTEDSKVISKEFPLAFQDKDFSLKPPKLDDWLGRRAKEKGKMGAVNNSEEALVSLQLKVMDIAPPLIDLYANLYAVAKEEPAQAAIRTVQAALQQWGRAFYYITKRRREAALSATDPNSYYLLKRPQAFAEGGEACKALFTENFYDLMIREAKRDEALAWRDKVVEPQRSVNKVGAPPPQSYKRTADQNKKRTSYDTRNKSAPYPAQSTSAAYGGTSHGGRGRRGSREERAGGDNTWPERRYESTPIGLSPPYYPSRGPQKTAALGGRLKEFAPVWSEVTGDRWILDTLSTGARIDFVVIPVQTKLPSTIKMPTELKKGVRQGGERSTGKKSNMRSKKLPDRVYV